jgi:hypothetical protein
MTRIVMALAAVLLALPAAGAAEPDHDGGHQRSRDAHHATKDTAKADRKEPHHASKDSDKAGRKKPRHASKDSDKAAGKKRRQAKKHTTKVDGKEPRHATKGTDKAAGKKRRSAKKDADKAAGKESRLARKHATAQADSRKGYNASRRGTPVTAVTKLPHANKGPAFHLLAVAPGSASATPTSVTPAQVAYNRGLKQLRKEYAPTPAQAAYNSTVAQLQQEYPQAPTPPSQPGIDPNATGGAAFPNLAPGAQGAVQTTAGAFANAAYKPPPREEAPTGVMGAFHPSARPTYHGESADAWVGYQGAMFGWELGQWLTGH